MSQNEILKILNDNLDEIIDNSKFFEEQIESLKKLEDLIDEKLFEQIFGWSYTQQIY